MQPLRPIGTDDERTALRWSNRRWLAARPGREWPAGVLDEGERLEDEYVGWDVMWAGGNKTSGTAPAYHAQWLGPDRLANGDQAYPGHPETRCRPRVLGATAAELVERIKAMSARIADQRAERELLEEHLRRGFQ